MKSKPHIVGMLILLCLFCNSCQTDKSYINNWVSHSVTSNRDTINSYNSSVDDWAVYLKNDSVRVIDLKHYAVQSLPFAITTDSNKQKLRGKRSVLKVSDGYLIGLFRGEWGGDLYWFSNNGNESYKVSGDEVVQFITRENKIYAIQGLAHLSISEGSIICIEKIIIFGLQK